MIVEEKAYGGALRKIQRLGLTALVDEVRRMLFELASADLPDDIPTHYERYEQIERVLLRRLGDRPEWAAGSRHLRLRTHAAGNGRIALGLSVTLAGGTEMLGIAALRNAIIDGSIDLAVLVILGDEFGHNCADPPTLLSTRRRAVESAAERLPILTIRFCAG